MAKKSLSRFLTDRIDIILMPRSGTSRKFKTTGWMLLCVVALWLLFTLGAFWALSRAYDYQLLKTDNRLMRLKMQAIAEDLERGRKYLELTQATDNQMRQMLGMPGIKMPTPPKASATCARCPSP